MPESKELLDAYRTRYGQLQARIRIMIANGKQDLKVNPHIAGAIGPYIAMAEDLLKILTNVCSDPGCENLATVGDTCGLHPNIKFEARSRRERLLVATRVLARTLLNANLMDMEAAIENFVTEVVSRED